MLFQERAQRAQILDLETQLNQMRAECVKLKHDKEEVSSTDNMLSKTAILPIICIVQYFNIHVVRFDSRFSREPDLAVVFHVFWKRTFQDNW